MGKFNLPEYGVPQGGVGGSWDEPKKPGAYGLMVKTKDLLVKPIARPEEYNAPGQPKSTVAKFMTEANKADFLKTFIEMNQPQPDDNIAVRDAKGLNNLALTVIDPLQLVEFVAGAIYSPKTTAKGVAETVSLESFKKQPVTTMANAALIMLGGKHVAGKFGKTAGNIRAAEAAIRARPRALKPEVLPPEEPLPYEMKELPPGPQSRVPGRGSAEALPFELRQLKSAVFEQPPGRIPLQIPEKTPVPQPQARAFEMPPVPRGPVLPRGRNATQWPFDLPEFTPTQGYRPPQPSVGMPQPVAPPPTGLPPMDFKYEPFGMEQPRPPMEVPPRTETIEQPSPYGYQGPQWGPESGMASPEAMRRAIKELLDAATKGGATMPKGEQRRPRPAPPVVESTTTEIHPITDPMKPPTAADYTPREDVNIPETETGAIRLPETTLAKAKDVYQAERNKFMSTTRNLGDVVGYEKARKAFNFMAGAKPAAERIAENGWDFVNPETGELVQRPELSMNYVLEPVRGKTADLVVEVDLKDLAQRKAVADSHKGLAIRKNRKAIHDTKKAVYEIAGTPESRELIQAVERFKKGDPTAVESLSGRVVKYNKTVSLADLADDYAHAQYYDEAYMKGSDVPRNPGVYRGKDWLPRTLRWIDTIKATVEDLAKQNPDAARAVVETADRLVVKHKSQMDFAVMLGVESPESYARITHWKYYINNKRDMMADMDSAVADSVLNDIGQKAMFENQIKSLTGGSAKTISAFDSAVRGDMVTRQYFIKQWFRGKMAEQAAQNGFGKITEIPDYEMESSVQSRVKKWEVFMRKNGLNPDEMRLESANAMWRAMSEPKNISEGELVFRRNGKWFKYKAGEGRMADDFTRALKSFEPHDLGAAANFMASVGSMFRTSVVTRLAFNFFNGGMGVYEVPIRSKVTSPMLYPARVVTFPIDLVRAVGHMLGKTEIFEQLMQSGGEGMQIARPQIERRFSPYSAKKWVEPSGGTIIDFSKKMGPRNWFPTLENLSAMTELIPRLADGLLRLDMENIPAAARSKAQNSLIREFEDFAYARTHPVKKASSASIQKAVADIRKVQPDYADTGYAVRNPETAKGLGSKGLGGAIKLTPFSPAAVSALYQFNAQLFENPAMAIKIATGVIVPAIALWFQIHDKKYYKDLPLDQKNRFIYLSEKVKLKMGFEIGAMFNATMRLMDGMEALIEGGNPPDVAKSTIADIGDAFQKGFMPWESFGLPVPIPKPASTLAAIATNMHPSFQGPIVPEGDAAASLKAYPSTPDTYKMAAGALSNAGIEVSPTMMDFVGQDVFGQLSRDVTKVTDPLLRAARGEKAYPQGFGIKDIPSIYNIPPSSTYSDSFNSASITGLYKIEEKVNEAKSRVKAAARKAYGADVIETYADINPNDIDDLLSAGKVRKSDADMIAFWDDEVSDVFNDMKKAKAGETDLTATDINDMARPIWESWRRGKWR